MAPDPVEIEPTPTGSGDVPAADRAADPSGHPSASGPVPPGGPSGAGPATRVGVTDLLRLAGRLGRSALRPAGERDAAGAGCRWARELMDRDGSVALELRLPGRTVRAVGHLPHSVDILSRPPYGDGHRTGTLKAEAMAFLAPGALTIADGERWTRLRAFNERVLTPEGPGAPHPAAEVWMAHVRGAFAAPVTDLDDVRAAMARAMTAIVLGESGTPDAARAADDVTALFGAVQSPLRRKLLGFRYRGRRERLYRTLARRLDEAPAGGGSLLARARTVGADLGREELLHQVPHWMFTFTGSGSDLLARTLALLAARPEALERARAETKGASAGGDLPWLEACLRETGRLFPPVTKTFHRPPGPAEGGPPPHEVAHWFPLLQRDPGLGPSVGAFRPERWLAERLDAPAAASNLFLRGPRACPGEDLILLVCETALARLVGEHGLAARASRLSRDPLPVSFPAREARFTYQGGP
jgi:cytochrome P450